MRIYLLNEQEEFYTELGKWSKNVLDGQRFINGPSAIFKALELQIVNYTIFYDFSDVTRGNEFNFYVRPSRKMVQKEGLEPSRHSNYGFSATA
jgi:hypothetical protein